MELILPPEQTAECWGAGWQMASSGLCGQPNRTRLFRTLTSSSRVSINPLEFDSAKTPSGTQAEPGCIRQPRQIVREILLDFWLMEAVRTIPARIFGYPMTWKMALARWRCTVRQPAPTARPTTGGALISLSGRIRTLLIPG